MKLVVALGFLSACAHALPTRCSPSFQPVRPLRIRGGSSPLSKNTVFNVGIATAGIEGAAQTCFPEMVLKGYGYSMHPTPALKYFIEAWGVKACVFSVILYLSREYSLLTAFSCGLVVDSIYDFYVLLKWCDNVSLLIPVVILKVAGAFFGLGDWIGTANHALVVRAIPVLWTVLSVFGVLARRQMFESTGLDSDSSPITATMRRGLLVTTVMIGAFLWFHQQSDALALALALAVGAANFAFSVAVQEWKHVGFSNGLPPVVWAAITASLAYCAAAHA